MNWKEQIRDWWYKYHDGGYEMPEQMRVDIERIFKHSQQQLLESLEEELKKRRYNDIVDSHLSLTNERFNNGIDVGLALIQSKKSL